VYASTDKEYARFYASKALHGSLYLVSLDGNVEPSAEDPFPTWRGRRAIVLAVLQRSVVLTMGERRRLFRRWAGSDAEFADMVAAMGLPRPGVPARRHAACLLCGLPNGLHAASLTFPSQLAREQARGGQDGSGA
jgi:hypothetical protein